MKISIENSVTVVTPTIGTDKLKDAALSVLNQTYSSTKHLIVVDGAEHNAKVNKILLNDVGLTNKTDAMFLPYNVGANGFYGHRVYAAIAHLVNSDYVMFLDEDNWFGPDHVKTLVETLESEPDLAFAHSLRRIYSPDKTVEMEDNCESLGQYPVWVSLTQGQPSYLVDTSSFIFKREFLVNFGHIWDWGWGADRRFFDAATKQIKAKYKCSNLHTLNYRLDGNPNSVNMDFFVQGNDFMLKYYGGELPWKKTP